jgi:hypothetical protein
MSESTSQAEAKRKLAEFVKSVSDLIIDEESVWLHSATANMDVVPARVAMTKVSRLLEEKGDSNEDVLGHMIISWLATTEHFLSQNPELITKLYVKYVANIDPNELLIPTCKGAH